MKRILVFSWPLLALLLSACSEEDSNPRTVNNQVKDTTYVVSPVPAAQTKSVLIEDFTGVRCANCPNAQKEIVNIMQSNPGRIVAIGQYANNATLITLTLPYSYSTTDLRTQFSGDLYTYLGASNGLPAGSIDRKQYPSEQGILVINFGTWASYVNDQLALSTPFNIALKPTFNGTSREVEAEVTVTCTKLLTDTAYLTLALIESDIISAQEQTLDVDTHYVHNHVLRTVLTPTTGKLLDASLVPGRVFIKTFKTTLPVNWNEKNMELVAFVHHGGNSKEVWQVAKIELP